METTEIVSFIFGALMGCLIAQLMLIFFQEEIFTFIDRIAEKVRKACGLS